MIISTACQRELPEFRSLVDQATDRLNRAAQRDETQFLDKDGKKLEPIVCKALSECATGTAFEGTVTLVSGQKFPDIVAKRLFGVEVKSTKANEWTSTGSSILESSRIDSVERIFLTFGKLGSPVEFISKPYEDCMSEIAVTHYPRYRIDMKLQEKNLPTIFEKMHIDYDDLRRLDDPVPPVADYYRRLLRPGESLWWAGSNLEETAAPMVVRLWNTLSPEEKRHYVVHGCAMFPEIFSNRTDKYNRYALWLATQCGIVNTNIRDGFSAGGKVSIIIGDGTTVELPAIYGRVYEYCTQILEEINNTEEEQLKASWGTEIVQDRIHQWCSLVSRASSPQVDFVVSNNVLTWIFEEYVFE